MSDQFQSVESAAAEGSTRDLLVAMRARIAVAVDDVNTPARDLAALTKRLADVVREIESIDARVAEEGVNGSDETPGDEVFDPASA